MINKKYTIKYLIIVAIIILVIILVYIAVTYNKSNEKFGNIHTLPAGVTITYPYFEGPLTNINTIYGLSEINLGENNSLPTGATIELFKTYSYTWIELNNIANDMKGRLPTLVELRTQLNNDKQIFINSQLSDAWFPYNPSSSERSDIVNNNPNALNGPDNWWASFNRTNFNIGTTHYVVTKNTSAGARWPDWGKSNNFALSILGLHRKYVYIVFPVSTTSGQTSTTSGKTSTTSGQTSTTSGQTSTTSGQTSTTSGQTSTTSGQTSTTSGQTSTTSGKTSTTSGKTSTTSGQTSTTSGQTSTTSGQTSTTAYPSTTKYNHTHNHNHKHNDSLESLLGGFDLNKFFGKGVNSKNLYISPMNNSSLYNPSNPNRVSKIDSAFFQLLD